MPTLTSDDFVRLATLFVPETVSALTFSPDGTLIAVAAGDKVHVFKVPAQLHSAAASTSANTPASGTSAGTP